MTMDNIASDEDRDDDKDIKVISLIFVFDLVVVFFEILFSSVFKLAGS